MSSYTEGKEFLEGWIRGRFPEGSTCLDVGACDGNWFNRLGEYLVMDAVEIWQPNIEKHRLEDKYRLNSLPGEVNKAHYLRINNTNMDPQEAARRIKEEFGL